jgi:hypothetical protein
MFSHVSTGLQLARSGEWARGATCERPQNQKVDRRMQSRQRVSSDVCRGTTGQRGITDPVWGCLKLPRDSTSSGSRRRLAVVSTEATCAQCKPPCHAAAGEEPDPTNEYGVPVRAGTGVGVGRGLTALEARPSLRPGRQQEWSPADAHPRPRCSDLGITLAGGPAESGAERRSGQHQKIE